MINEEKILKAKQTIKHQLFDFNVTIAKIGRSMNDGYFVSGGCIGSLIRGEIPKDYDIYFCDESFAKPIISLYTEDPSYQNEVAVVEEKYRDAITNVNGMCITENAVTLKNGLQLITKHYGEPEVIRDTFDFVHCKPYYFPKTDKLYISEEQYDLNIDKKLKVNNTYNLTTHREFKFKERGWTWL